MFDQAISKILSELKPHRRVCKATGEEFEIDERMIGFYQRLKIPPPTWAPIPRRNRRMAVTNFNRFHRRKCDATGESVISQYSQTNPHIIYKNDYWWSDKWDPMSYGRPYDFSRSFFDQFNQLRRAVPRAAINRDSSNQNSDYVIAGSTMKDCYFVFGGVSGENCLYVDVILNAKNCMDCAYARESDYCYENVMPWHNSRCKFAIESANCLDSSFIYDCRNCTSCFLCANLRNKQYCFMNEQMTKETYEAKVRALDLGNRAILQDMHTRFLRLREQGVVRATNNVNAENCVGDDLIDCRDCFESYQTINGENLMFSPACKNAKDIIDLWGVSKVERGCELLRIYDSYDIKFSSHVKNSFDVEYSDDCYNVEHCFGSVGLRLKKYCILNKQYSESEYRDMVDRIKTQMLEAGEYGEFFPLGISPVPYNDSYARYASGQQGLWNTDEAVAHGAWAESDEAPQTAATIDAKALPDRISEVKDDIIGKVIRSAGDERPYTIIKPELSLYREWNLPLPHENYYERANRRALELRGWRPFSRACTVCDRATYTSVRPDYPGQLYCNDCYLKTVG